MNIPEHPIRRIRNRLKLSQAEIAAKLAVTQTTWSKYERGDVDMPPGKARELIRLAKGAHLVIGFDHVYEDVPLPPAQAAQAGG